MKILLATDGSDSARAAVDFVRHFPFPEHSEVTVLTVLDESLFPADDTAQLDEQERRVLEQSERAIREEAEQLIQVEAARLGDAGRPCSTALRIGHAADEIVKTAEALQSELIVVGSHGRGSIKSFLMGSASNSLLHYAPCSVLIVKDPHMAEPATVVEGEPPSWNILLAYDSSKPATNAVQACASLPLGEAARVTALTVLPLVTIYRQDIRQRMSVFWRQKKAAAQDALDQVVKALRWATPHVSAQLRESPNVCQAILDTAAELGSNLILLGDKGAGTVQRFLLGSVTHRVARHAKCAVWVVRNRD